MVRYNYDGWNVKKVLGWYIPLDKMLKAFEWALANNKDRVEVAEKIYLLTNRIDANKAYKKGRDKTDVLAYLLTTERIQKESDT